jgi:hypothetical protein
MVLTVLTYGTHEQGYLKTLKQSCMRYGYDLRVLGMGEKWQGYGKRFLTMIDVLKSLPADQLVMCVDAFDVFMCGPASAAIQGYRDAGSPPMLVGAARVLFCGETIQRAFFNDHVTQLSCMDSPYTMICAGTYMCTAGNGYKLLSSLLPIQVGDDDQMLLASLRNKHGDNVIKLDCSFRVFATLQTIALIGFAMDERDKIAVIKNDDGDKRLYSGVTNSWPCVVHGPGNTDLSPLINEFEFESQSNDVPTSFYLGKLWYLASNFVTTCPLIAIAVIVILVLVICSAVYAICFVASTLICDRPISTQRKRNLINDKLN